MQLGEILLYQGHFHSFFALSLHQLDQKGVFLYMHCDHFQDLQVFIVILKVSANKSPNIYL